MDSTTIRNEGWVEVDYKNPLDSNIIKLKVCNHCKFMKQRLFRSGRNPMYQIVLSCFCVLVYGNCLISAFTVIEPVVRFLGLGISPANSNSK